MGATGREPDAGSDEEHRVKADTSNIRVRRTKTK